MNPQEIEELPKPPQTCPECKSAEGFWLIAKRDGTFFQCKHCRYTLETCRILALQKQPKDWKLVIRLQR